MSENLQDLKTEWQILHNNYEDYEKYSLLFKLSGVAVCLVYLTTIVHVFPALCLLILLWLSEAIWKTFQSRIGDRLVLLEDVLHGDAKHKSFNLYSQWFGQRPAIDALVKQYLNSALRPTVVFPHIFFALLVIVSAILY